MKLKRIILSLFFPERCKICGEIKPFLKPYCPKCSIDTKIISPDACRQCGHKKCICHKNISATLPHLSAVYYYQGQLKRSIHQYKFYGESSYAEIFGKAMADKIKADYPDTKFDGVCFVPMTDIAIRKRGYNQSELLAGKVAEELKLPLVPCLKKSKEAPDQKDLTSEQRRENIKESFAVIKETDIIGKTLILCDDIKTTGATLKECSNTLMKAGAKDIYCLCLALTPYLNETDIF